MLVLLLLLMLLLLLLLWMSLLLLVVLVVMWTGRRSSRCSPTGSRAILQVVRPGASVAAASASSRVPVCNSDSSLCIRYSVRMYSL